MNQGAIPRAGFRRSPPSASADISGNLSTNRPIASDHEKERNEDA
jgi:hypothetical protein